MAHKSDIFTRQMTFWTNWKMQIFEAKLDGSHFGSQLFGDEGGVLEAYNLRAAHGVTRSLQGNRSQYSRGVVHDPICEVRTDRASCSLWSEERYWT